MELFLHPAIRQINFSLNSFDKNEPKITLEQYLEPIFQLCIQKLKNKVHNFINFRLWNQDGNENDEEFNQMVFQKLCDQFHIDISKYPTDKPIRLENKILLHFDSYFEWPNLLNDHFSHGTCHGLSAQMGILSDGTVVPCCLDSFGVINLGNIFHTPLADIVNSKRSQDIIRGFQEGKAIEELCQKCSFKDRFL